MYWVSQCFQYFFNVNDLPTSFPSFLHTRTHAITSHHITSFAFNFLDAISRLLLSLCQWISMRVCVRGFFLFIVIIIFDQQLLGIRFSLKLFKWWHSTAIFSKFVCVRYSVSLFLFFHFQEASKKEHLYEIPPHHYSIIKLVVIAVTNGKAFKPKHDFSLTHSFYSAYLLKKKKTKLEKDRELRSDDRNERSFGEFFFLSFVLFWILDGSDVQCVWIYRCCCIDSVVCAENMPFDLFQTRFVLHKTLFSAKVIFYFLVLFVCSLPLLLTILPLIFSSLKRASGEYRCVCV